MNEHAVVSINAFQVPSSEDAAFLAGWERAHDFLLSQPGYRSSQLHRSTESGTEFRYVNVAVWDSEDAFRAATASSSSAGSVRSIPSMLRSIKW